MKIYIIFGIILFSCFSIFASHKRDEHHLSRGEQLVNNTLGKNAKIIKKKYNLRPCGAGAAMPGGSIQELTLCFSTPYAYSKEQLRNVLVKSAEDLLSQVHDNEEIQKYLKELPFTIKNIEIIIYNYDKNGSSVTDPEISVARISQGEIIYRTADPEDKFKYKNVYKETYEEAVKEIKSQKPQQ